MSAHTAADVIEIATLADSPLALERALLSRLQREVAFDVGFFVRPGGIGPGQCGIAPKHAARMRERFGMYAVELAPVFARARRERGVAVDRDTLGRAFEATHVYREFVAPHGGHSTALVMLSLAGQGVATLALG